MTLAHVKSCSFWKNGYTRLWRVCYLAILSLPSHVVLPLNVWARSHDSGTRVKRWVNIQCISNVKHWKTHIYSMNETIAPWNGYTNTVWCILSVYSSFRRAAIFFSLEFYKKKKQGKQGKKSINFSHCFYLVYLILFFLQFHNFRSFM